MPFSLFIWNKNCNKAVLHGFYRKMPERTFAREIFPDFGPDLAFWAWWDRGPEKRTFCCPVYLDASKAFDRVNHVILFEKLLARNIPNCIWYSTRCILHGNSTTRYYLRKLGSASGHVCYSVYVKLPWRTDQKMLFHENEEIGPVTDIL